MKYAALFALLFFLWDGLASPPPHKMNGFQSLFFLFGWFTTLVILVNCIFR